MKEERVPGSPGQVAAKRNFQLDRRPWAQEQTLPEEFKRARSRGSSRRCAPPDSIVKLFAAVDIDRSVLEKIARSGPAKLFGRSGRNALSLSSCAHGGSELFEQLVRFGPVDAAVGHALAVSQCSAGNQ